MGVDYVDVFYSHRYDPETPLEETLQALVDIVRQGKSLYVGISRWPMEAAAFAYEYLRGHDTPCLLYQGRINMLDREPVESGILRQASDNGAGFVAFSPLAQGLLTNRYLGGIPDDSRAALNKFLKSDSITDALVNKINALNDMALSRSQTLAQMALAWVLHHKEVTSVIIGCSSVRQLSDSIGCLDNPEFTPEELAMIDRLTNGC